jgi:hypothetical protein
MEVLGRRLLHASEVPRPVGESDFEAAIKEVDVVMRLLRVGRKIGLTYGTSSLLAEVNEREGREQVLRAVRGGAQNRCCRLLED